MKDKSMDVIFKDNYIGDVTDYEQYSKQKDKKDKYN